MEEEGPTHLSIQFVLDYCTIFFLPFTCRLHEHGVRNPCLGLLCYTVCSLPADLCAQLSPLSLKCLKNSSYLNQIPLNLSTSFNNTLLDILSLLGPMTATSFSNRSFSLLASRPTTGSPSVVFEGCHSNFRTLSPFFLRALSLDSLIPVKLLFFSP